MGSDVSPFSAAGSAGQAAGGNAVRRHNLGLALTSIADSAEPLSRAGLAAATGMTRATAGSLVDQLIEGGLLVEVAQAPVTTAGRPATGLLVDGRGLHGLGLEVDVDYLAATVLDATGRVGYREVLTQDQRGVRPEEVLARLGRLATRAIAAAAPGPFAGAAVAVPGLVDAGTGLVRSAPNLGWYGVEVLAILAAQPDLAGVPLRLGNEADYSALAELHGPRPPSGDFVLVSGETGIGAGIVIGGRLLTGGHGWGGEIGHVCVEATGPACPCGSRGCLEQYAGQAAILRSAGVEVATASRAPGSPPVTLITQLAHAGEPAMIEALRAAGEALGLVIAGVLNVLDVATVVLGGVYAPLAPWLRPALVAELDLRVVWSSWLRPAVSVSALRSGAACQGAAAAVVRAAITDPASWLDRRQRRDSRAL